MGEKVQAFGTFDVSLWDYQETSVGGIAPTLTHNGLSQTCHRQRLMTSQHQLYTQLMAFLAAKREQSCQAVYTTFGSRSVIKCIGSLSVRLE